MVKSSRALGTVVGFGVTGDFDISGVVFNEIKKHIILNTTS